MAKKHLSNSEKKRQKIFDKVYQAIVLIIILGIVYVHKYNTSNDLLSSNFKEYNVTKIIDGDTIEIESGEQVRFIGIDTPEIGQPFADNATLRTKELIGDNKVIVERDTLYKDRYNRILGYVWVDNVMINEVLLQEGLAKPLFIPPDFKYKQKEEDAYSKAFKEKRGLWKNQ